MIIDDEMPAANGALHPHEAHVPGLRQPRWYNYTAFVLSGGGARGALQVGALRALLEHGERPDLVIGTSVGAWNGAWLAMGPSEERMETMARVWAGVHPLRVLLGRDRVAGGTPQQAIRGMLALAAARNAARNSPSLYSDAGLQQLLTRFYAGTTFEGLEVPLHIIATNLTSGVRAVFSSGPIGPALLASSAIPGIFPPVRIGNETYVDGGAIENSGLDLAITLGARRIFILDVGFDASPAAAEEWAEPPAKPATPAAANSERSRPSSRRERTMIPHSLAAVLERTTQVMSRYQLDQGMAQLPPGIETHLIRPSTPGGGSALDFDAAPGWIEHGYAFTRGYLSQMSAERMRTGVELTVDHA